MKVTEAIDKRWSPRAFSQEKIEKEQIISLLKSAGSAASCFNEQPWRYIVGFKGDSTYDKIFSTLVEFNQNWCKTAPVLMLGVVRKSFAKNGKPNDYARHDLGQATALMTLHGMQEGIYAHQMAGFSADSAREEFNIPEEFEAVTAIALGHLGDKSQIDPELAAQENPNRSQKDVSEFAFQSDWGQAL